MGHVKACDIVRLTRTPGPHVVPLGPLGYDVAQRLCKARSGTEWWSSEELELRIPHIVNEERNQSILCCTGLSEWLYEMVAVRNVV